MSAFDWSQFPEGVRASMAPGAVVYHRQPGRYVLHGGARDAAAGGAIALWEDGEVAVFSGEPAAADGDRVSPAYAQAPGGTLAAPTGRVFIRFAAGVSAAEHRADIERAGYEIVEAISYAPEAAWLRASSGGIAAALHGLARLAALAGVENVEPQILLPRTPRA